MDPTSPDRPDPLAEAALAQFRALVESVGTKRFAASMGLSTRQVNRILGGSQPNPIERLIRALQSVDPDVGDRALDFVCQEMGGHFVRLQSLDDAAVNAVKECAEAIVAISDGRVSHLDVREVRDAISALEGLTLAIRDRTVARGDEPDERS